MTVARNDLPVVAHSVTPYLPKSGSWIHSQITGLTRYRTIVVTKRVENLDTFPFDAVFARSDLSLVSQLLQRLGKRRLGYFPFYRAVLERERAKLLHSHFGNWGYQDLALKLDLGIPQVSSFYGADIWKLSKDPVWCERYRRYFEQSDCFLLEGNAMRAKVMSMGCPSEKALVHHLGVDLTRIAFEPRRLAAGENVVLFLAAGRAVAKKGHDMAVRAFARVHRENRNTRLGLIVIPPERGAEEALAPIRNAIAEEKVEHAVDLHSYLPYPEYLAALKRYHVFLAPSRHAPDGDAEGGFPVALLEMSASGMPIVASDHCDIPEAVLHEKTGRIFRENDVDGMAAAMLRMAAEPEKWARYAAEARAHVEREYDIQRQALQLETIYDRLLAVAV